MGFSFGIDDKKMLSGTLTLDLRNGIKDQGVNLLPPRELMHVVANSTMMNDFKGDTKEIRESEWAITRLLRKEPVISLTERIP